MSERIIIDHEALKAQVEEIKKAKRKKERKVKWERTKEWWRENSIAAATVIISGIACVAPIAFKVVGMTNDVRTKRRLEKIEHDKDYRIYDRSLGCYLNLKRKLTRKDFVSINDRKVKGEKIVDILNDMNVLK